MFKRPLASFWKIHESITGRTSLKAIFGSRYAHLLFGLLMLYGLSLSVTHTTQDEKILDSLRRYCKADYRVRDSLFNMERFEAEFYREKYRERLESLSAPLFDYRDRDQVRAYFLPRGFLYDVREEGRGRRSYLLAKTVAQGTHEDEIPEMVSFHYFVLGKKKISPYPEHREGRRARRFVSSEEGRIYIHRDSLESMLRWYFDSLWETGPKSPGHYYSECRGVKDPLTYFLYRDLREVCEDIFVKRLYLNKKEAREYFVDEGFNVFLPTMLAMGARMASDQDSGSPEALQYLKALLTGLSLRPNHTMFYLLTCFHEGYHPTVRKIYGELRGRVDLNYPDTLTLDKISMIAHEFLEKLEGK